MEIKVSKETEQSYEKIVRETVRDISRLINELGAKISNNTCKLNIGIDEWSEISRMLDNIKDKVR